MKKTFTVLFLHFFLVSTFALSGLPYPEIENLNVHDVFFNQYSVSVANARKAIARGDTKSDITPEFYTYVVKKGETLLEIAARCCIPYDAIVTLNRISSNEQEIEGTRLILPSLPALYLYEMSDSAFECLLLDYIDKVPSTFEGFEVSLFTDMTHYVKVYCLPNVLFDGTLRALFFMPYYQYPLDSKRVTSGFGLRKDPFTGKDSYHQGIDIAAPLGASVHAIAGGKVIETGRESVLGNYIIIQHNDGRQSVYGHLSTIFVTKDEIVKSGKTIGAVGSTGRATGNHLHLEIRESNVAVDPSSFFKD